MTQPRIPDMPRPPRIAAHPRRWWWLVPLALAALALAAVLALRIPGVGTAAARVVLARLPASAGAHWSVATVRGDWITGLDLRGLKLARADTTLLEVDSLRIRHDLGALLAGRLHVRSVELAGVIADPRLLEPGPAPKAKGPPLSPADLLAGRFYRGLDLQVDRLAIRGSRLAAPRPAADSGAVAAGAGDRRVRFRDLHVHVRDLRLGRTFGFEADSLSLAIEAPGSPGQEVALTATASLRDGRLELPRLGLRSASSDLAASASVAAESRPASPVTHIALHAKRLDLADLAPFLGIADPAQAVLTGVLVADADLRGPALDRVSGTLDARLESGRLGGMGVDDVRLDAAFEEGAATLTLSGRAESAPIAISGTTRPFDARPRHALRAELAAMPARLPGLAWWSDFASRADSKLDLAVDGEGWADLAADVTAEAQGALGHLSLEGRLDLTRGFAWSVSRLALEDFDVAAAAGDERASRVNAVVAGEGAQESGKPSRARLTLDLGEATFGDWALDSGRLRANLDRGVLGASLELARNGGTLHADTFQVRLGDASPFRIEGLRLRHLDLAEVTGDSSLASDLSADADVEGGGLAGALDGARPATARGNALRARGTLKFQPSTLRGRRIERGELRFTLQRGDASIDADVATDAGALAARLLGRPFDAAPTVRIDRARFDGLDPGAWAGRADPRVRLSGELTGEARFLAGTGDGAWRPGEWRAALSLRPSDAAGIRIERADLRAASDGGPTRIEGFVGTGGSRITVDGEFDPGTEAPSARGRVELPMAVLAAWAGRDTLPVSGTVTIQGEASGPFGDPARLAASIHAEARGAIDRARVDSLRLDLRIAGGVATLDSMVLASNFARGGARGRIALADTLPGGAATGAVSDLRGEFVLGDLAALRALLGADSLALGQGTVAVEIAGAARDRELQMSAELLQADWNGIHASALQATGRWRPADRGRAARGWLSAEGTRLRLGMLEVARADARVDGDGGPLRFELGARGRSEAELRVVGTVESDSSTWDVAVAQLDLRADATSWHLGGPARLRVAPDRYELTGFEIRSSHGRVAANGVIDRRGTQSFDAVIENLGLRLAARDEGDVLGRFDGRVEIRGPATAPRSTGALRVDLTERGSVAGRLAMEFLWNSTGLDLEGAFRSPSGDSVAMTGHLPVALDLAPKEERPRGGSDLPASLRLVANGFALEQLSPLLAVAQVRPLGGTLGMDVRLEGSGRAITGTGRIGIERGSLEIPSLGVRYDDVRLAAECRGDRLRIEECRARTGGGGLELEGSVRFADLRRIEPDLRLRASQARFTDTPELRVTGSGSLHLQGTLVDPRIEGELRFSGCQYQVTEATFVEPGPREQITLSPEDLRQLEDTFLFTETTAPDPLLGFYDAADLELELVLESNNWVRQTISPRLAAELTGEFRLSKRPHREPLLYGTLSPVAGRGFVEQFGRSFRIAGGDVLLNGAMGNHTMDLRADYGGSSGAGVLVHLDLRGPLDAARLELSSEPSMSETEIVTYIVTGRPPTTRGAGGQSFGSDVASLGRDVGLAAVTGAIGDAAQRSVGLDVLKVNYDALQGTALVAGRYVTPRVYAGIRQPLQGSDLGADRTGERFRTQLELEYQARRWLILSLQGESSLFRSFIRVNREY